MKNHLMELRISRMVEIPKFELFSNINGNLELRWESRDFPEDVTEYLLSNVSTIYSIQVCIREINQVLTDLCQRGLLWKLRKQWVYQPYIWDELSDGVEYEKDFLF